MKAQGECLASRKIGQHSHEGEGNISSLLKANETKGITPSKRGKHNKEGEGGNTPLHPTCAISKEDTKEVSKESMHVPTLGRPSKRESKHQGIPKRYVNKSFGIFFYYKRGHMHTNYGIFIHVLFVEGITIV